MTQTSASGPDGTPLKGGDPHVSWGKGQSPNNSTLFNAVEAGDLNTDGITDVIAGFDGQGLYIWLGNANGSFTNVTTTPAISGNYNDICIGDINNDGKPDIAATRQGGISAWFGDGSGTGWGAQVGPGATGNFNAITLDDVNLDGDLDLVTAVSGTGVRKGIQIFLGNGNGGWSNGDTNMPLNVKYNGVVTGDINNDGKPDIVAAGDFGVDAWTGNGGGSWTSADSGLPSSGTYSDVDLADIDHDGDLDLVASGGSNNGVMAWRGNGAGLWDITLNLPLNRTYTAVECVDVNLDGYIDILTTSSNTNEVVWTGDGQFNWYPQNDGLPPGNFYLDLSLADINNDGRTDMCVLNSIMGIETWHSVVDRTVNSWSQFQSPSLPGQTVLDLEVADINLDGKQDICYATQSSGIVIFTGDGSGNWTSFASPVSTGSAYGILICDFNIDGKPDIIASQSNGIRAWSGNAQGTWVLASSGLPSSGAWFGIAAADFNDDGKIDIAGGSGSNAGLFVWNGNGAGIWTQTFTLPFTGTYHDIESTDVNGDGALDIIVADGGLRVFLGNMANGWTESSAGLPGSTSSYKYVKSSDMGDNGKPEVIGTSPTQGVTIWNRGAGGTWSLQAQVNSTHGSGIAIADFTIDGALDICVGSSQSLGVSALKQNGMSWPAILDGLSDEGNYLALEMADINIDGMLDIVTYNNTGSDSRIWIGTYIAPPTPSFSIGPLAVGWNLVSVPLVLQNGTLPWALTDLDSDTTWTRLKAFDCLDPSDPWKSFVMGGTANDLHNVNGAMGLWLYIPDIPSLGDAYIRLEGEPPTTSAIPLYSGWNLVGYPSAAPSAASTALPPEADIVSVFLGTSPFIEDRTDLNNVTMSAGNGYWVHVSSDCLWNVEY